MTLSKEAKQYLADLADASISFYQDALRKINENKFLSINTKIRIKQGDEKKIRMFKEILRAIDSEEEIACPTCGGTKEIVDKYAIREWTIDVPYTKCPDCEGSGVMD